jgi:hypothetical protein
MEGGKGGTPNRDRGIAEHLRARTKNKPGGVRPGASQAGAIREHVLDTVWTRGNFGASPCR